jgi:DNA invertase Pin-like site-specific DNA recombinase
MRVGILVRSESLFTEPAAAGQVAAARDLAAQQGWEVSEAHIIDVRTRFSGNVSEHPAFVNLLEDAARGCVDAVIVETVDTPTLREAETLTMAHALREFGVAVWCSSSGRPCAAESSVQHLLRIAYRMHVAWSRDPNACDVAQTDGATACSAGGV